MPPQSVSSFRHEGEDRLRVRACQPGLARLTPLHLSFSALRNSQPAMASIESIVFWWQLQ